MNEHLSSTLQTIAGATAFCLCFYFLSTCVGNTEREKQETRRRLIDRGFYEESPGRWIQRNNTTPQTDYKAVTEAGSTN